jgi:hypothetical protein
MTTPAAPTIEEFRKALAKERRQSSTAAKMFEMACRSGDVDAVLQAVDLINESVDGWRLAMLRAGRLPDIDEAVRNAFLGVWVESKTLPLSVGDRRTLTNALYRLMPRSNVPAALRLYRGAGWEERRRRVYGFCWTTQLEIARGFAEHWRQSAAGGVILETIASPEAVFLVREDQGDGYYEEAEVVVDPFKLQKITVAERLTSNSSIDWRDRINAPSYG